MAELNIRLDVYVHNDADDLLTAALARVEQQLDILTTQGAQEMADLTAIQTAVAENGDIEASAVLLLGQLAELIRANATDQVALNDLATTLDSQADALAAAVTANTPAAPEPTPEPPV